jgi:hypothetical protein
MRTPIVICCAYLTIALAGCAGSITPSQLEPPAAVLLKPPAKLSDPKAGDDLVQEHIELRRLYSSETNKYRRLQRWTRTVLGK